MKPRYLSALAFLTALCPAAAWAQGASGSVTVGAVAPVPNVVTVPPPPPGAYVGAAPVAQAPVVQMQPGYAPPGYGYAPMGYAVQVRRRVVPYTGGPVPANAHLEDNPILGLAIGGGIALGVGYVPAAITGLFCTGICSSSNGLTWLLLPVAGPWIAMTYHQSDDGYRLLVFDGVIQAAGLGMLIAGLAIRNRVVVYNDFALRERTRQVSWAFSPGAAGAGAGLSFSLTHF